jgi:hypothetical protein
MLSKFQNDVKTTESRLVNEFHNQVGQVIVRFDAFEPIVGANTTYLFPGQEMKLQQVWLHSAKANFQLYPLPVHLLS